MKLKVTAVIFALIISFAFTTSNVSAADCLTKRGGVYYNEDGYKETYYNLSMKRVVQIMRDKGYTGKEYRYWIRSDGVRMFGDYVMVAADLSIHPKGDIVNTSLGTGIVVDTGSAIQGSKLDIATTW